MDEQSRTPEDKEESTAGRVDSMGRPMPRRGATPKPPHRPRTHAESLAADSIRPDAAPAHAAAPAYDAVFFDMDGTLIDTSVDGMISKYSDLMAETAPSGLDGLKLAYAMGKAAVAVDGDTSREVNEKVFWREFAREWDGPVTDEVRRFYDFFHKDVFPRLGSLFHEDPDAPRAIASLKALGYPLYLTTQPLFNREADDARLRWAGIDPSSFARVTTLANSRATKPHADYFLENLSIGGFEADRVLMVGNDTSRDMGCLDVGMDAFLVTDHLIDTNHFDAHKVKHGTIAQFADWVAGWPACTWDVEGNGDPDRLAPEDPRDTGDGLDGQGDASDDDGDAAHDSLTDEDGRA